MASGVVSLYDTNWAKKTFSEVRDLIDAGADVNEKSKYGTPVYSREWFTFHCTHDIAKLFICAGVVPIPSFFLHATGYYRYRKLIILCIIDYGYDVNTIVPNYCNVLHSALMHSTLIQLTDRFSGSEQFTKIVVDAGIDLMASYTYDDDPDLNSLTISIIKKCSANVVKMIIEADY